MLDPDVNDYVVLVASDPDWPSAYDRERTLLCQVLGGDASDIQHIGSTAVFGLSAKPTIDILVAVPQFDAVEEYARRLAPLGYQHVSHPDDAIRLFFRKGNPRTHHLHIVQYGSWEHRRHILFRDYLRAHLETAREYEQLKRELVNRFGTDRPMYTESKSDFIHSIIARAAEEKAGPEELPTPPDLC